MTKATKYRAAFALIAIAFASLTTLGAPQANADQEKQVCCSTCENAVEDCVNGRRFTNCHRDPTCCSNSQAACFANCNPNC